MPGLSKVAGKVFRIGHLGDLNELMLLGALGGAEMAMRDVGIDIEPGSGVAAAQEYWRRTDPVPKKRVSRQEVIYASHSVGLARRALSTAERAAGLDASGGLSAFR